MSLTPKRRNKRYRHGPYLMLGGVPFEGTDAELKTVHELLDQVAHSLELAQPLRFPKGTGKARQTLLLQLRLKHDTVITAQIAQTWLATLSGSVF